VADGENQLHELAGKMSQLQLQADELERNGTLLSSQVSGIINRPSVTMPAYPDALTQPELDTGQCCRLMGDVPLIFSCSDAIYSPSF
jgi:hypothetical protein